MRAGGCSVSQALTPDAAIMVKQAIGLARRRGHAQVTPLHVANTMLTSASGLLRAACLQSHSHPLQCKALELCFNVALNRLPAASSASPLLPPQHPPSLSNALVAAFKRAQAHQRRGTSESQQQPLLSVKIELEQLVVSILDDPSVSRVMREAGFSSTQVKSNVEHTISSDPNPNPNPNSKTAVPGRAEDVSSLVECLMSSKKKSVIVVGECVATTEGVVKGLMDRVDNGQVPETLRNLQFVTLPLVSFNGMLRGEVEQKVAELRCLLMKSCCLGRAAVLYLEDIRWVAEYRAKSYEDRGGGFYCPVEHVIMEIGRLVCAGINGEEEVGIGGGRFWLMGTATYQTYMRCKVGNPSLEIVWALQPFTIPVGSLGLSLSNGTCDSQRLHRGSITGAWPLLEDTTENQLTCCTNFPIKFEKDANGSTASTLPSWLQNYKEKNKKAAGDEECLNSNCRVQDHTSEMALQFSSTPSPSSSGLIQSRHPWSLAVESKLSWRRNQEWISESIGSRLRNNSRAFPFTLITCCNVAENPNHLTSSVELMEMEGGSKFKELNAENLRILCNALERRVPWKKAIVSEIASTVLQCRDGMARRKKEDTWLLFQGGDAEAKEKIARELASVIFGSQSFFSAGICNSSSTKSDSTDDALRKKRFRPDSSHGFIDTLAEAVRENPHRVFLVEDVEQVDSTSQMAIRSAIEKGNLRSSEGEEVAVSDGIFILSCSEGFESSSAGCSPPAKQRVEKEMVKESDSFLSLDLNVCAEEDGGDEVWCCGEGERLAGAVDRTFFFKPPEDL